MKKFIVSTVLALLLVIPVLAATTDFTSNSDITVSSVSGGEVTSDMLIMNGSTAESWTISGGTFTVTNPGTFKVGSGNTAVKSIKVKNAGGTVIACADNTSASTTYVTLPSAAATYTVTASTDTSCAALCGTQTGVSTYYKNDGTYTLPTCGALTCSSPYALSAASGSTSATCNPPGVAAASPTSPSGPSGSATPTTTTTTKTPTTTPTTTTTTTAESPTTASAVAKAADMIKNILSEAATIFSDKPTQIAANMGIKVDAKTEDAAEAKYTAKLVSGLKAISEKAKDAITYFVAYGSPTTKILGAGERAGVVNSYKSAFGKVPATEAEWSDAIKIGNGRWPAERSTKSENNATTAFKKIYKREPDRKNSHDDAAVTVISYGLRPSNRNLNSEKAAIKSFKAVYDYDPKTATAWDVVRAIAYSGAKR